MKRLVAVIVMILLLGVGVASARTWRIIPDGTGDAPTIQAGVDSATAGDLILLADGAYTGEGNRDILCSGKEITVKSERGDPEACVIDCEGSESEPHRGFHFECGGCHSHLEGLKIINGYAYYGGGIFDHQGASSLSIINCSFSDNYSSADGGAVEGMLLDISGCVFSDNSASWYGGAVCASRETSISECLFERNTAGEGGALLIQNNGREVTETVISGCVFIGNTAVSNGGAVVAGHEWTNFRMEVCILAKNAAAIPSGGVIGLGSWSGKIHGFRMDGCTVAGNEAGIEEISLTPGPFIDRTIIAYNSRGVGGCAQISCCDIYGNREGDWTGCIADQYGLNGNFSLCPSFCDIGSDLQLCDESPCLSGNHPDGYDCGLIGALGEGCTCAPSATRPITWGAIKSTYR